MQALIVIVVMGSITVGFGLTAAATARGSSWGPLPVAAVLAGIFLFGLSTDQATNQFVILAGAGAIIELVVSRRLAAAEHAEEPTAPSLFWKSIGVLIGIAATLVSAFLTLVGLAFSGGGLLI